VVSFNIGNAGNGMWVDTHPNQAKLVLHLRLDTYRLVINSFDRNWETEFIDTLPPFVENNRLDFEVTENIIKVLCFSFYFSTLSRFVIM